MVDDCHRSSSAATQVSGVVVDVGDTTSCALSPARFRQSASGVHATLSVVRRPRLCTRAFRSPMFFSLVFSSVVGVSNSINDGFLVISVTFVVYNNIGVSDAPERKSCLSYDPLPYTSIFYKSFRRLIDGRGIVLL